MRWVAALIFLISASSQAQLSDSEKTKLSDALLVANLKTSDLSPSARHINSEELPLVRRSITNRLETVDELLTFGSQPQSSAIQQVSDGLKLVFGESVSVPAPSSQVQIQGSNLPAEVIPSVERLVAALSEANKSIQTALKELTPTEQRQLIEGLPSLVSDHTLDFVHERVLKRSQLLQLVAKVDLKAIRAAGVVLDTRVNEELPRLINAAKNSVFTGVVRQRIEGLMVEIGGIGNDLHDSKDTNLLIDLGGDDTYLGRFGAGIGYASVQIDLSGNDIYEVPDASLGVGILGIGLSHDLGGNDRFLTKSASLGAGIAGFGLFAKNKGNDLYSGDCACEGFGFFGIGVMVDSGGDDHYQALSNAQGCGSASGFGWLIDRDGDDTYTIKRHTGQGAGASIKTEGGGVGILQDLRGDDIYRAPSFAQGAARQGIGLLIDQSGNDLYSGQVQAQGYADSGFAMLADLSGNDHYSLNNFGIAYATDAGFAMMFDREGNDNYSASGEFVCRGEDAGTSLLFDVVGDDSYAINSTNSARTGVSLFVDTSGSNRAVYGSNISQLSSTSPFSTSIIASLSEAQKPSVIPSPDSSDVDLSKLWSRASEPTCDQANMILQLVRAGKPAFERFLEERVADATKDETRIAARVLENLPPQDQDAMVNRLNREAPKSVLFTIISRSKSVAGIGCIETELKNPDPCPEAIQAAGQLKLKSMEPRLLELIASNDLDLVANALRAFALLGSETPLSSAKTLVLSQDFTVRREAFLLLLLKPTSAFVAGEFLAKQDDEQCKRLGIRLLASCHRPEADLVIESFLSAPTPGLKIEAMLCLNRPLSDSALRKVGSLMNDSDHRVQLVAYGMTASDQKP